MKKVLMVGNSPSVRGGITTVIGQYRKYDFKKHDIKLNFIPTYKDTNAVIKVLYFFCAYFRIILAFIINKPDIVHIHMSYRGSFTRAYLIQKLAIKFHIKNIIHLHGSEFKKWYDSVNKHKKTKIHELLTKADEFIVLGDIWNKIIKEIEPQTNTIVLNNSVKMPIDVAHYKEKKNIIFVGMLIKRKGVHDLIEALSKLDNDNYNIIIAGSGEEQKKLENLAQKYKIKNIEFLGWVSPEKRTELLLSSQYMILPSYNEGLPMSILEAMSCGVPVISTYVGDIPSVIKDGSNGFLYKAGDIKGLTGCLKKALGMNNKDWNALSKKVRATIKKTYSEETYFDEIVKIYTK